MAGLAVYLEATSEGKMAFQSFKTETTSVLTALLTHVTNILTSSDESIQLEQIDYLVSPEQIANSTLAYRLSKTELVENIPTDGLRIKLSMPDESYEPFENERLRLKAKTERTRPERERKEKEEDEAQAKKDAETNLEFVKMITKTIAKISDRDVANDQPLNTAVSFINDALNRFNPERPLEFPQVEVSNYSRYLNIYITKKGAEILAESANMIKESYQKINKAEDDLKKALGRYGFPENSSASLILVEQLSVVKEHKATILTEANSIKAHIQKLEMFGLFEMQFVLADISEEGKQFLNLEKRFVKLLKVILESAKKQLDFQQESFPTFANGESGKDEKTDNP